MKYAGIDRIIRLLTLAAPFLLGVAALSPAYALPKCASATPEHISEEGYMVDMAWQRYRLRITPEHRCCAKPCEPIERFAAKVETTPASCPPSPITAICWSMAG